jgi:hypothetical protein
MDLLPWVWLVAYLRARPGRVDTGSSMFGCPRCLSVLVSDLVLFIKISRTQWWNRFNNFILYLKDIIQIWKKNSTSRFLCYYITGACMPPCDQDPRSLTCNLLGPFYIRGASPSPPYRLPINHLLHHTQPGWASFFYACVRRSVGLVL